MTAPTLPILYEDAAVLAVDKPAGLVVHAPESGGAQPTVAEFALERGVEDSDTVRPGIVHRLDKDTSGVLLVAKTPEAKAELQRQFHDRRVAKTYLALVEGQIEQQRAVIQLPLARHHRSPTRRRVSAAGRPAVTEFRRQQLFTNATLLEVQIHTGRTHQIRVHLAHIRHPVMGDTMYGRPQRPAGLLRQFLHAAELSFWSPVGKQVTVASPLPADLKTYLTTLQPLPSAQ